MEPSSTKDQSPEEATEKVVVEEVVVEEAASAEQSGQQTLSGKPLRDVSEGAESTQNLTGAEAVKAAATGKKLTPSTQVDALQWFMNPDVDPEAPTKTLRLNFGTGDKEMWVPWVIQPVEMETMRRIRDNASKSRKARRTGEIDEYSVNIQIVIAGTVSPPIGQAIKDLSQQSGEPVDANAYMKHRFHRKPGYISQIAGSIMSLSGFDAEDVQESEQVEAAGNS
jgi:hypothetical protein